MVVSSCAVPGQARARACVRACAGHGAASKMFITLCLRLHLYMCTRIRINRLHLVASARSGSASSFTAE